MSRVVVDASIALAWCFPDEISDYAEGVLIALERRTMLVPAIWSLEIANAILMGERRKRLGRSEIEQFARLLESIPVVQDARPVADCVAEVLPLARKHGLSACDAAYLDLAIRYGTPLATADERLHSAARSERVKLFEPA